MKCLISSKNVIPFLLLGAQISISVLYLVSNFHVILEYIPTMSLMPLSKEMLGNNPERWHLVAVFARVLACCWPGTTCMLPNNS